jgi:hypothetical protein
LIDGFKAFVETRKTSELEAEVEFLRGTVAKLTELVVQLRGAKP